MHEIEVIMTEQAWEIARQSAREAAAQLGDQLRAVILIGSLAEGAYRPGRSDIDTALIVRDAVTRAGAVRDLAQHFQTCYRVPKSFGAVVIRERELHPPYDPERGLVKEILRSTSER